MFIAVVFITIKMETTQMPSSGEWKTNPGTSKQWNTTQQYKGMNY